MPNYNSNLQINNTSLQEILNAVNELPDASGGIELPELTNEGIASDLLAGKELIDGDGNKVTGTMPTGSAKTPATTITKTPSISVNSSGLITASVSGTQNVTPTVSAGYVSSGTAGTITVSGSATKQLTTQAAKTVTPTTSSQTAVASGRYTTGAVTVAGDANLVASNIKKNTTIFGVTGTYEGTGGGTDTSDATATADEIFAGETAYGADGKVTGTFTIDNELADEGNLLRQLQNALKGKAIPPSEPSVTTSKKDVNFYDYDGTLLYSYTVEEAQALTELPPLPTQPELICQEWNYDLETIKSYNRAVDIGATYITDDGKTRLYIRIAAEGRMTVPLYFSQTVANGVTIDWGDGSDTQTIMYVTGNTSIRHTYANIGDYIITLEVTSGILGLGYSSSGVLGSSTTNTAKVYCNILQKVEIGSGVTSIGNNAFASCYSLANIVIPNNVTNIEGSAFDSCYSLANIVIPNSVTNIGHHTFDDCHSLANAVIPNSVTSVGSNEFYQCHSLASVVIPNNVTSIASSVFGYCHSLASVAIPNGITSIGHSAFYNCYSLASIVIPDSVTNISPYAFYNCYGMAIYDFTSHTSIPTLSNTDAFSNIPSDCVIKVPAALYDEWIAATNWSEYASQIVAV